MATLPPGFAAQAGKGRPKGSQNKTTTLAKTAIAEAFEKLGGIDALVDWARSGPDELRVFYGTIYPKLIPLDVAHSGTVTLGHMLDAIST